MSDKWRETTLGAICDEVSGTIQTGPFGSQLHESDYSRDGVPVVMPKDIIANRICTEGIARVRQEHVERLGRHKLRAGDIVYGRRGDIGRQALVKKDQAGWLCGTGCLRISLGDSVIEPMFLHYYLQQEAVISWIANQAIGATMPNLNTAILRRVPVRFPSLPLQREIVAAISAYDDLIDNNTLRIETLEDMARALYREWFVEFHFPGYEARGQVSSSLGPIPEGWQLRPIESLISLHIGGGWGKDRPDEEYSEPAWVIRGTDIPDARACHVERVPHRFHTVSNVRSRRLREDDILFEVSGGSKGQPLGRTVLVTRELLSAFRGDDVICASFCKLVRPATDAYSPEMLYLSFREGYESGEIEQFQVQSTGISNFKWTEYIQQVLRVVPPESLCKRFREVVSPFFAAVGILGLEVTNLRRTRDLLLLRLMAGRLNLGRPDASCSSAA